MIRTASTLLALFCPALLAAQGNPNSVPHDPSQWPQHSMERPKATVVTPGPYAATPRPSDAIVLMDGHSLAQWRSTEQPSDPTGGKPGQHARLGGAALDAARWKVVGGYTEVVPGSGGIATRDSFGDIQLHVEWSAPLPVKGEGQERGNSGVFLMGTYEVQVLDSWHNDTYTDGQAGALFGQFPPLVNPIRRPGQWNSYDIVFHRPHFRSDGTVESPGRMTVFFNGVLVQDDQALLGPTTFSRRAPYSAHADKLPLELQDHEFKVRYRNIWVRRLE